jgi:hypothetical protein
MLSGNKRRNTKTLFEPNWVSILTILQYLHICYKKSYWLKVQCDYFAGNIQDLKVINFSLLILHFSLIYLL